MKDLFEEWIEDITEVLGAGEIACLRCEASLLDSEDLQII